MNRKVTWLLAALSASAGLLAILLVFIQPVKASPGDVLVDRATGIDQANCGNGVNPPCYSIKYAVENVAAAGDSVLVAAGTYTEAFTMQPGVDVVSQSGQEVTIIDGEYVRGPMVSAVGATITPAVRLEGFTITGGHASWLGGAVFVDDGASMVISNTRLISNTADTDGGGISLLDDASLLLYGCTLEQHSEGALRIDNASATILHSAFLTNTRPGLGSWGGGIIAQYNCTLVISDTLFQGNHAHHGGGLIVAYSTNLTLRNSEFYSNTAGDGGAIQVCDGSTFEIRDNTIEHNEARGAGGIGIHGGSGGASNGVIVSNTVRYNQDTEQGGAGIEIEDAAVVITGNQIISNTSLSHGGGGIRVDGNSTFEIRNNTIAHNVAPNAGGIGINGGNGDIISNTLEYNQALALGGGGIQIGSATVVISGNQIISNTSPSKAGGGIRVAGEPTFEIRNNTIEHNLATSGGGIAIAGGSGIVADNMVRFNQADGGGQGGGIGLYAPSSSVVSHNWVADNARGGILASSATATIENNFVVHNGGGEKAQVTIYGNTPIEVINNTIVGNGVDNGVDIKNSGSPTITNNIVAGNTYGIRAWGIVTPAISYNNLWDNSVNYEGVAPGTNDISCDPDFVDAANDYHLGVCSCAVDAGTNTGAPAGDYDGDARPVDGDGDGTTTVDIGADERLTVTAPLPVAGFTYIVNPGLDVIFTNTSNHAVSYEWDFGDGVGTSTVVSPSYTYGESGSYTVTLRAICAYGCSDTYQGVVEVKQHNIYLPLVLAANDAAPMVEKATTNRAGYAVWWMTSILCAGHIGKLLKPRERIRSTK